jgi:ketosteroid isomerase-like protein
MAYAVTRSTVDTFYKVYGARDPQKLGDFLHPDIVWTTSGPIDVLPYCGIHRGKAAVLDLILKKVPSVFHSITFVPEAFVVDGDRLAMLNRRSSRCVSDGRMVSFRVANFMRFCDDKVIENLSLLDSFDAAEQVLGHSLTSHADCLADTGNLVAV